MQQPIIRAKRGRRSISAFLKNAANESFEDPSYTG
jgi:hypothetical protein